MPRVARERSKSGIYHIIIRGINRQTMFEDEEDRVRFIDTLRKYREVCEYQVYAYCLMDNHVHLLLKEGKEPLETFMRKICSSYVLWYNRKYGRIGYLFQDRFKSEPVEDDSYFLTVLRYIFQNPVKAGIVSEINDYLWTNYQDYVEECNEADKSYVLGIFNTDRERAIRSFAEYINKENDDECLDIQRKRQLTDDEAKKVIKDHCKLSHATELQNLDAGKRNSYLKDLKKEYSLPIRQIERVTGISRGIIQRI